MSDTSPKHSTPLLRVGGVPEHFNLPWRDRALNFGGRTIINVPFTYTEFPGGTGAMTRALNYDEVDIALLLTEGAVADIAKGGTHRIVKVYVETPLEWGIHVAENSRFATEDDIEGQRYAISRPGSGSQIMAAVHAASRRWDISNLHYVEVKNLEGARRALAEARADSFFWEKSMTHPLVAAGEFRRVGIFTSPWPSFVVCASNALIENHPALLKTLLDDIQDSAALLKNDCDSATVIASIYGLTLEAAEKWLLATRWSQNFSLPIDTLENILSQLKTLDHDIPNEIAVSDLIYPLTTEQAPESGHEAV